MQGEPITSENVQWRSPIATLRDMPCSRATATPDTPILAVERMFVADPTLSSVVVPLDRGGAVCVSRAWFFAQLMGDLGYGRSLYARHPIRRLPRPATLVLDADTTIADATRAVLSRENDHRYDDIVVRLGRDEYAAIVVAELFAELAHNHAYVGLHDPLTSLPNRRYFLDRLRAAHSARAQRQGRAMAVLFVDLDEFKPINDVLGHEAGDLALIKVAQRLNRVIGAQALPVTVARLGGDEFGVLIEEAPGTDEVVEAVEHFQAELSGPVPIGDKRITLHCSIGVALDDGVSSADELLRNADLAMYTAKRRHKGGYAIYEETMHVRASNRLQLRTQLEGALDRGEFKLHYQPIVELAGNTVVGGEALLRWERPGEEPVGPGQFIPVCEQMGMIGPLGLWVLREACEQVTAWQHAHPDAQLHYAVNISPLQLQEPNFVASVEQVLRETGMPAADLVLEITENVFIDNQEIIERIAALKRLGIRLALDDFGTGFSSLGYLSRLPIDILKLDRRFVAALGDTHERGVMRGIVALARTLQLQTIGEGVETVGQADELRAAGCERAQGYFFAKPMPWSDYEALLGTGLAAPTLPLEPASFRLVA